jgi:iron-regulated transporter 1
MRRIDLVCKLLGPLVVSLVAIASIGVAIWTTLGMNMCSVIVEYVAIEQVIKPQKTLLPSKALMDY